MAKPAIPRTPAPSFAPATQTLFAPIVQLAPPGPGRAARAVAILDRQIEFQRKISFHPKIAPALQDVVDKMPPRQSTMIRAAALYSKPGIPWTDHPDGTHLIAVAGRPLDDDYLYDLTPEYRSPEEPARFSGVFGLKPAPGSSEASIKAVTGTLAGELLIDTYGIGAAVDAAAATLREAYGDLHPPWDTAPGAFNTHDRAAMSRFHRQMPHLAAKFDEYFKFDNIVDEFNSPAGPIVLLNVDAEVHEDALKKYPRLYDFYRKVVPAVTARSAVLDARGNYWARSLFDRGHIHGTIMIRNGLLTPFNSAMQPAGESVALNEIQRGGYRTVASVQVTSLKMNFGLDNVSFATQYSRDQGGVTFVNRMIAVPDLIAPTGIHKIMDLVAGEFLHTLATGDGGLTSRLSSRTLPNGWYAFAGGATAELDYSPALELLARIGDAIARQHNEGVRVEERALGQELFDAALADYNDARPAILELQDD
ncbi:MAG TPA: hypothetical protein VEU51_11580 [Candidatus Acidoferrales bacterium]|nr:hypothetical protein [Candidatus Acidoferrales bacterium]